MNTGFDGTVRRLHVLWKPAQSRQAGPPSIHTAAWLSPRVVWQQTVSSAGHFLPAVVTVAPADSAKQLVTIRLPAEDLRPGLLTVCNASTTTAISS